MQETSPYNQSVENLYMRRAKRVIKAHKRTVTHPPTKASMEESNEANWNDSTKVENTTNKRKNSHSRSHSQPNSHPVGKLKYDDPLFNKVRNAKKTAETAIKVSNYGVGHSHSPARPGKCQELSGEYKSPISRPTWQVRFSYPEYIIENKHNFLLSTLK